MYNPSKLLDTLQTMLCAKNDAAIAKLLCVAPPVISKIRSRKLQVGAVILLAISDVTGLPTKEIRKLAGDRREYFRVGNARFSSRVIGVIRND